MNFDRILNMIIRSFVRQGTRSVTRGTMNKLGNMGKGGRGNRGANNWEDQGGEWRDDAPPRKGKAGRKGRR